VFSAQNKQKTLSWKSSQIFLWLESVFRWPTFLITNKHRKVWKVVSRKPLFGKQTYQVCWKLIFFIFFYFIFIELSQYYILGYKFTRFDLNLFYFSLLLIIIFLKFSSSILYWFENWVSWFIQFTFHGVIPVRPLGYKFDLIFAKVEW